MGTPGRLAPRLAAGVIRAACRALPDAERAERRQEWVAEAEAIAEDADVRLPALRAVWFAVSLLLHARATRSTHTTTTRPANGHVIGDHVYVRGHYRVRTGSARSTRSTAFYALVAVVGVVGVADAIVGAVVAGGILGVIIGVGVVIIGIGALVKAGDRRGAGE